MTAQKTNNANNTNNTTKIIEVDILYQPYNNDTEKKIDAAMLQFKGDNVAGGCMLETMQADITYECDATQFNNMTEEEIESSILQKVKHIDDSIMVCYLKEEEYEADDE